MNWERFRSTKTDVLKATGYVAGFAVLTSGSLYTIAQLTNPDNQAPKQMHSQTTETLPSTVDSDIYPRNELDLQPQDFGLLVTVGATLFLLGLRALDNGNNNNT